MVFPLIHYFSTIGTPRCAELNRFGFAEVVIIRAGDEQMWNDQKSRWTELCAQAAVERDPDKLLKLFAEINRLLDIEHNEIRTKQPDSKLAAHAA